MIFKCAQGILEKRLVQGRRGESRNDPYQIREEDRRQGHSAQADLKEKPPAMPFPVNFPKTTTALPRGGFRSGSMERARATLKMAEADLAYTELKAPFDGVIKKIFADRGEVCHWTPVNPLCKWSHWILSPSSFILMNVIMPF